MRYWDLGDKEKTQLTEAEIEATLKFELMEKGVLRPESPTYQEIAEIALEREAWYKVDGTNICFPDPEPAHQFLALHPRLDESDWQIGYEYHYPRTIDGAVSKVMFYDEAQLQTRRESLTKNKATKDQNDNLRHEYEKAVAAADKICSGVWTDYRRCQALARKYQKIVDTFRDYCKTANDATVAGEFLKKVFSAEEIGEVEKWMGVEILGDRP